MQHLILQSPNFRYLQKTFGEWLSVRGYAQTTVENSPVNLQEFFFFLEQRNILHVNKIEKKHALEFKEYLLNRKNFSLKLGGLSNGRINKIIQSLNSFSIYINEVKTDLELDIFQTYLPTQPPIKTILTQKEIKDIYNITFESYPHTLSTWQMGLRDRVIIAVFYGCGLRRNEAKNLNLSDVDYQNKRLLVRKGKNYKQRFVPIPNQHFEDIKEYIENGRYWFEEHHHTNCNGYKYVVKKKSNKDDKEALILSSRGTRMQSFDERLRYLTKRANIDKSIRTHALRHSLGTHLLQNGMEIEQISKILGHQSIDTTQIYTQIVEQLKQQENENF